MNAAPCAGLGFSLLSGSRNPAQSALESGQDFAAGKNVTGTRQRLDAVPQHT
jgi:hypothetical protein